MRRRRPTAFPPDLSQRLPTYETVLLLDPEQITAAGYELRGGMSCVWVEVQLDENLSEQYWVSVDSGLLVSAEMVQDGQLVYRMTAYSAIQTPCPTDASFRLPDGTTRILSIDPCARERPPAAPCSHFYSSAPGRSAFPLCPQGPSAAPDPAR